MRSKHTTSNKQDSSSLRNKGEMKKKKVIYFSWKTPENHFPSHS